MAAKKPKGMKWDGKSRVSNDLYRKNYNKIFRKKSQPKEDWWKYMDCAPHDPFKKEYDELKESSKQSKKAKKEREELLKEIEDRNGF